MHLNFESDEKKGGSNLTKHGVSLEEAATVFGDSMSLTIPDPACAIKENLTIRAQ